MKTLSQILEASAKVRAEQQDSENTAERVGGVLCDLTAFLQNKTALTGLDVRTDLNGVSIEVRAQTGDGQEASTVLKFPEASETQAGIITAALIQNLRAGIDGNSNSINFIRVELQECISKITALQSKTTYNGDNITKLFSAANTHDQKIAAAESAISSAQASIEENSDNIAEIGAQLTDTAEKADTATRILTFDGEVRNPTIQESGIPSYDSIRFDTARGMFLAVKGGKYYNSFIGGDDYNEFKGNSLKARTDRLFLRTDTKLVYTFDGSQLNPFILSSEQKNKLGNYAYYFKDNATATPSSAGLLSPSDKAVVGKATGTFDISANSLDNLTTEGTYYINGERTSDSDGLPIGNSGSGHTVNGVVRVLNSSINGTGVRTDKVVTQILTMSNRVGGDGHIWIRTGQGASESELVWGTWEKLQGLFEKAMVTTITDFNSYTTNGMYSGIYVGPGTFLGGIGIEQFSQFLIISNNGYAVASAGLVPQLSQLLYLLPHGADGSSVRNARLHLRTGIYNSSSKSYQFSDFEKIATSYEINSLAERISALEAAINTAK